jgi:hypothetical protein
MKNSLHRYTIGIVWLIILLSGRSVMSSECTDILEKAMMSVLRECGPKTMTADQYSLVIAELKATNLLKVDKQDCDKISSDSYVDKNLNLLSKSIPKTVKLSEMSFCILKAQKEKDKLSEVEKLCGYILINREITVQTKADKKTESSPHTQQLNGHNSKE